MTGGKNNIFDSQLSRRYGKKQLTDNDIALIEKERRGIQTIAKLNSDLTGFVLYDSQKKPIKEFKIE